MIELKYNTFNLLFVDNLSFVIRYHKISQPDQ